MMDDFPATLVEWDLHRENHTIKANLCPTSGPLRYIKLWEKFLHERYPVSPGLDIGPARGDSWPSRFGDWAAYTNLKWSYKALGELGCLSKFKDFMNEHADFMDVKVPNHTFFALVRKMIEVFQEIADAHPPEIISEALSVCLEFLVPLIDDSEHGPFLFANSANGEKLISVLLAPSPAKSVKVARDALQKRKACTSKIAAAAEAAAEAGRDDAEV